MKLFMSYYSDEEADAEEIADYLKSTFKGQDLEVFMASNWDSLAPGDKWEDKLISAVKDADGLIVLMSVNALGRSWINFEIGIAWALKRRILLLCHKGMTPDALPRPYGSLQAVDLNTVAADKRLDLVAEVVSRALNLTLPPKTLTPASSRTTTSPSTFATLSRTWNLRPAAHVGEIATSRFLVGGVYPCRPERAKAAGLQTGEALFVRLFLGATPEGPFVNAMVTGQLANFFETVPRDTTIIEAELRLVAAFADGENTVPLLLIEKSEPVTSM